MIAATLTDVAVLAGVFLLVGALIGYAAGLADFERVTRREGRDA
jgi:hypothetical protein